MYVRFLIKFLLIFLKIISMYGSRKYPYPPTEGILALDTPPPWNFHSRGYLSDPAPHPLGFPVWLAPTRKTISIENAVALYYYAKDDCSCAKEKKPFIHVNMQLIISILPYKGLS